MTAPRPQDYATHRRYDPWWHGVAFFLIFITLIGSIVHAWRHPSLWSAWQPVFVIGLIISFARQRTHVLTVQDRLIRLEMRVRLREVLPPALVGRIHDLTLGQLVALRFASDAELPGLVERCLAGEFAKKDEVKKQIRDWQPDWLRA